MWGEQRERSIRGGKVQTGGEARNLHVRPYKGTIKKEEIREYNFLENNKGRPFIPKRKSTGK